MPRARLIARARVFDRDLLPGDRPLYAANFRGVPRKRNLNIIKVNGNLKEVLEGAAGQIVLIPHFAAGSIDVPQELFARKSIGIRDSNRLLHFDENVFEHKNYCQLP